MSDGFRLKALGILLGSMRYGVMCGSHSIVWQVVVSCVMGEGGAV